MEYRLLGGDSLRSLAKRLTCVQVAVELREVAGADFQPEAVTRQEDVACRP